MPPLLPQPFMTSNTRKALSEAKPLDWIPMDPSTEADPSTIEEFWENTSKNHCRDCSTGTRTFPRRGTSPTAPVHLDRTSRSREAEPPPEYSRGPKPPPPQS